MKTLKADWRTIDFINDKADQAYLGNYLDDEVIINYKDTIPEYVLVQILHHVPESSPAFKERKLKECFLQKKIPIECLSEFEKNFKKENIKRTYESRRYLEDGTCEVRVDEWSSSDASPLPFVK